MRVHLFTSLARWCSNGFPPIKSKYNPPFSSGKQIQPQGKIENKSPPAPNIFGNPQIFIFVKDRLFSIICLDFGQNVLKPSSDGPHKMLAIFSKISRGHRPDQICHELSSWQNARKFLDVNPHVFEFSCDQPQQSYDHRSHACRGNI